MAESDPILIVGAGLAGAKAAEGLREEGFEGSIVLLGSEPGMPYERPPLSKDYLRGEMPREETQVHPSGFYDGAGIELRAETTVESIDPAARQVVLASGERLDFGRLLLATGARSRRLPIAGAELAGVHHLRELADSDRLAEALAGAERLAIVGGGWIGAEVAASARQLGVEVVVLERGPVLLGTVLGAELGSVYQDLHTERGARIRTGVEVERLEGGERVERVRLVSGEAIDCDVVLVAVGAVVNDQIAAAAGIEVDSGILVDERLESSIAGTFAAGDVANASREFFQRRLRIEHWANAIAQGERAARTMLGKPPGEEALPYFFSDQYDLGMEYTGHAAEPDGLVVRGDLAGREFIAFWLEDGRVVAGMNANVWDVADDIGALIRSRSVIDPNRLRDEDVSLSELAGAPAG